MVRLEMGVPYNSSEWARCNSVENCADPKPNDWPADETQTIISSKFANKGGAAVEYLRKRSYTNATLNKVLLWMTENQATGSEGAKYFLKNYEDVWTKWVPADTVKRVKQSL